MDNLKMQSPNLVDTNIDKIAALFPSCITEDRDENGVVRRVVDFDQLRQELSASLVEGPRERYTLNWPGKNEAILIANAPISMTLRPCEEESVDFENTKNIYIEGDNLDALKLLQETYLNTVKMIFIDPPYNTGKDFLYKDNFTEDKEEYDVETQQKDAEGNRLVLNTESNGRFHSDWLSMIYPRLKLARNLLSDDGLIFISIDDNEVVNLRKVCDEIMGEENCINTLVWKKRYNAAKERHLALIHEYVLVYAKNAGCIQDFAVPGDQQYFDTYFTESDEFLQTRGKFMTQPLEAGNSMDNRPNLRFPIIAPDGAEIWPRRQWVWGKEKVEEAKQKGQLKFYTNKDGDWKVRHKQYMRDELGTLRKVKPFSIYDKVFTQHATVEFASLFNDDNIFPFPKPSALIAHLAQLSQNSDGIVLDFFSGSATTAHAVMQVNAEYGGKRKFIMVQLPEACDEKSGAFKAGYKTIAEIGKERIRRAGKKIKEENPITAQNLDIGFRVLKVDTSNMKDVYYTPDELKQDNLELFKDHIKPDRGPEDLLFQVFIDWGLDLTKPISKVTIDGKTVFIVDTNDLIACFDSGITEELVKKLAAHKPLRVVFRDDAFGSDSVKINVEQIFKLLSPGTDVKSI